MTVEDNDRGRGPDASGARLDAVTEVQYDPDDGTRLSDRVLAALDSVPGYDVEDSETVVYDHVDLDALDALFEPAEGGQKHGSVTFPVGEYEVTARASGEVTVRATSVGR